MQMLEGEVPETVPTVLAGHADFDAAHRGAAPIGCDGDNRHELRPVVQLALREAGLPEPFDKRPAHAVRVAIAAEAGDIDLARLAAQNGASFPHHTVTLKTGEDSGRERVCQY